LAKRLKCAHLFSSPQAQIVTERAKLTFCEPINKHEYDSLGAKIGIDTQNSGGNSYRQEIRQNNWNQRGDRRLVSGKGLSGQRKDS